MYRKIIKAIQQVFSNNIFVIGILWKISKIRFAIKTLVTIISSIMPVIKVIIIRYILSLLENGIFRSKTILNKVILTIILLTIVQLATKIFFDFNNVLVDPFLAAKVNRHMNDVFFERAKSFEYKNFEDPGFYDKYTRALSQVENIPHVVFNSFFQFIGGMTSVLSLSVLIFSMDWKVIFFGICIVIINFIQSIILGKLNFNTSQLLTPISRRQNYIKTVLYNSSFAKEIQNNSVITTGQRYYHESFKKLLEILKKYGIKIFLLNLIAILLTTLSSTSMMIYLFIQVWHRVYTIADYSALMSSSSQFESALGGLFDNISNFYKNSLEINNLKYIYFYKREDKSGNLTLDTEKPYTLEVKGLYFKYPHSKNYVLKNVSFMINSGQKISIVGFNGSGKSTLIKLLIGLYKPQKGEIFINGINIKEYKREELCKKIGIIFQDYQIFAFSIKENILFEDRLEERIIDILEKLGLKKLIDSLPKGMETSLSKEFDSNGTLLSGGEAQKICIARALNKSAGLFIFDEPSSALDPVSEYRLNKMLFEITNKTIIFISHRLSMSIMSDNILLLNNGELVEQGTHEELIEKKGLYFELFFKQYREI